MSFFRSFILFAVAITAALSASAAAAQEADREEPWHPDWGDWSVAFDLPEGGGAGFGFWIMSGENVALGLRADGSYGLHREETVDGELERTVMRASFGPAFKRYWWTGGPVAPFFRLGAEGTYSRVQSEGSPSEWRLGAGASLGLGADWFPAEGISIGGHTGVQGQYQWTTDDDEAADDLTSIIGSLFTSGLTLHLYF